MNFSDKALEGANKLRRKHDPDVHDLLDRFAKHIEERLQVQFHGWGETPSFTCKNLYMNGHFGRYTQSGKSYSIRGHLEHIWLFPMIEHDMALIRAFMEDTSKPMPEWVPLNSFSTTSDRCSECGNLIIFETDGHVVRVKGEPCPYPNGYPIWSVEINCRSGYLVFDDDLREWFRDAEKRSEERERSTRITFETEAGMHWTALDYAKDGCFTAFIGNSNPRICRSLEDPNTILLGNPMEEPGTDEPKEALAGTETIGWINTCLWWFSVADFVELHKRDRIIEVREGDTWKFKPDPAWRERDAELPQFATKVAVEPGRYRMTYLFPKANRDDWTRDQVYAKIERVGDVQK